MPGGRNGKELCNSFDDSENNNNKPVGHAPFTLETPARHKRQMVVPPNTSATVPSGFMGEDFRIESDSMGEMRVPAHALYGAQTARAVENFPISGLRFPRSLISALGLIKKHAARTNAELGLLPGNIATAIEKAATEVIEGKLDEQFVVDVFQTGSGTSTNMNANEVIANRATQLLEGDSHIHPN